MRPQTQSDAPRSIWDEFGRRRGAPLFAFAHDLDEEALFFGGIPREEVILYGACSFMPVLSYQFCFLLGSMQTLSPLSTHPSLVHIPQNNLLPRCLVY